MIYENILDLIGRTPVLHLTGLLPADAADLFIKLERFNPGGSIKDRPALEMITAAERDGRLRPGGTIVESSSCNLGAALAMIAAARNYRCIIVVDPRTSRFNIEMVKAFGGEIELITEANPLDGTYQEARIRRARELVGAIPGAFMPWQYGNPDNPRAIATRLRWKSPKISLIMDQTFSSLRFPPEVTSVELLRD